MNKEENIFNFIKTKYKKKINLETKIFVVLDLDSLEFVKLVRQFELILKKKYKPNISQEILSLSLKKFLAYFK